ncbi:T9SS type A sorting domain-containing protein [Crocinitomix catalasitica]|nr:T9SS type A sorting domain-containing protein [Crocinitomix catalasitica]
MKKNLKTLKLTLVLVFSIFLNQGVNGQSWWAQTSSTGERLQNINFFNNNIGFSFGDTLSTMVKTTNSGALWSGLSPVFTAGNLRSSSILSASSVITVGGHDVPTGKGLVMKSTDGGVIWSVDTGIVEDLFDVSFVNLTDGWISGENGYIARTTDAAGNWLQLTTGTGEDIFSIQFVDANEGWAVGTVDVNAVILHTIDAGTSWTPQTSGIVEPLFAVHFVDNTNGWAVGAAGSIITTSDGGSSWTPQSSGVTVDLVDVDFLDMNKGWAVGGGGTVIKTIDGGLNWVTEISGTTTDIKSIHMRHDSLGWFCGGGGEIRVYAMNPPTVNIFKIESNLTVNIYPNPATDWVKIELSNYDKEWSIILYDISGKVVDNRNDISESSVQISADEIVSGIYFIEIINSERVLRTEKIVFK